MEQLECKNEYYPNSLLSKLPSAAKDFSIGGSMTKILLVEDNKIIIEFVESVLTKELKASVVCFNSGNDAIDRLKVDRHFDLIISDYHMPNGTGYDLLEFATKNNIKIPFILFTSTINPELPKYGSNFYGTIEKLQLEKLIEFAEHAISENNDDGYSDRNVI